MEEQKHTLPDIPIEKLVPPPLASTAARGDSNRITRDYFDAMLLEFRHIGNQKPSTKFDFLGKSFDTPIMCGGMAAVVPLLHEGGMAEMARGMKEVNGVMWCGYVPDEEFARVCETGASAIRIIKPLQDEEQILAAIAHDEAHGAMAVAMDIDHGFDGNGEYCAGQKGAYSDLEPKTADDLKRYVNATKLPFIAKGILSVCDAQLAAETGAKAIVLSHHKGEYGFAVPPALVLPEIRRALGADFPIIVDCGIISGIDVFKALALGASGVCVARPMMAPFKKEGAAGIQALVEKLTRELAGAMAKTGAADIRHIDPEVIHIRTF